jgi:hypothetical protein
MVLKELLQVPQVVPTPFFSVLRLRFLASLAIAEWT